MARKEGTNSSTIRKEARVEIRNDKIKVEMRRRNKNEGKRKGRLRLRRENAERETVVKQELVSLRTEVWIERKNMKVHLRKLGREL